MEIDEALRRMLAADHRMHVVGPRQLQSADGGVFEVRRRDRSPSAAAIHADLVRVPDDVALLYVVDRVGPALEELARSNARIAAASPDTIWFRGHLTQSGLDVDSAPRAGRGPRPYGRFAVARALLAGMPLTQSELAHRIGITQPSVSNALRQLGALVVKARDGWKPTDRQQLFRYAADDYPGTAGITTYWWHDGSLEDQLGLFAGDVLVSGDLAARRINAWRRPEHVVLYTRDDIDPADLGFALTSRDDYTLELTVPTDRTIWATAELFGRRGLADPVIVARDVLRTGRTGDEAEAAEAVAKTVTR